MVDSHVVDNQDSGGDSAIFSEDQRVACDTDDPAGLQPYVSYQTSGIEWLGHIPSHWGIVRAKALFRKNRRMARKDDEVVTCFRDGTVTLRRLRRTTGFTESLKEIGYQGVRKGDLVIHTMDAFAGAIGVADSGGKSTSMYSVCSPHTSIAMPHYYAYCLREMARTGWILALAKGIRERSTDFRFSVFSAQWVPLPPLAEQAAIARVLSHWDMKVRRVVEAKQKLVELLVELKASVISEAVTGQVDVRTGQRYAAYKPSGIDWLGQVPDHWRIVRAKTIFTKNERMPRKDDEVITCFRDGSVTLRRLRRLSGFTESLKELGYQGIRKGDLVIHTMDAFAGAIGVSDSDGKGTPVYAVCSPRSRNAVPLYFALCLREMARRRWILALAKGIRERSTSFSFSVFGSQWVPLPSRAEQVAIAESLDHSLTKITNAISNTRREIAYLDEYRTRMIADVVTGKLDVRGAAACLKEAAI